MLKSKFKNFLNFLKDKKVLITTHDLVDIDGLVSCISLKYFLNQYFKTQDVYLSFSELSKLTRDFLDRFNKKFSDFNISLEYDIDISEIGLILILDTNNLNQVKFNNIIQSKKPYIFIDHHLDLRKSYKGNEISLNIIFEDFSSTAEIIFKLYEIFNIIIPPAVKYLLISAILTDSGFFAYGNNDTIIHVSKLLDNSFDIQEIILMLKKDKNVPEKLAKIKGTQRAELIRAGEWLIGVTHVGSYEASVASTLIKIGFDISIVYSEKKTEFRITTRAKKKVCLKTGLHLGKILEELSDEYKGSGGGHDGAASINCIKGTKNIIIDKIIDKVKQILNKDK